MIRGLFFILIIWTCLPGCTAEEECMEREMREYLQGEWDSWRAIEYWGTGTLDTILLNHRQHFVDDTLFIGTTIFFNQIGEEILTNKNSTYRIKCSEAENVCFLYNDDNILTIRTGRIQIIDNDNYVVHHVTNGLPVGELADIYCTSEPIFSMEFFNSLEIGDPLGCSLVISTRRK